MNNRQRFRFRTLLSLTLMVAFSAVLAAQDEGAVPSTESSLNRLLECRLAKILPHDGQLSTADKQTQPPTTRLETELFAHSSIARPSRDKSSRALSPDSLTPRGSPVAAERYVFGRMDLATGDSPESVA